MTRTQLIDEWVYTRRNDLEARELANSLRSVGPDKPLGQFGYPTTMAGFWEVVKTYAHAKWFRGLTGAFLGKDSSGNMRLFLWHDEALRELLARHHGLLMLEGVPLEPIDFINWTRENIVPWGTPMFELVADAYGDKTNPLRSDVLPGVPESELLSSYLRRWNEPDPVGFYHPHGVSFRTQTPQSILLTDLSKPKNVEAASLLLAKAVGLERGEAPPDWWQDDDTGVWCLRDARGWIVYFTDDRDGPEQYVPGITAVTDPGKAIAMALLRVAMPPGIETSSPSITPPACLENPLLLQQEIDSYRKLEDHEVKSCGSCAHRFTSTKNQRCIDCAKCKHIVPGWASMADKLEAERGET